MFDDPSFRLHHVGIVVPEIDNSRNFYINALGYRQRTELIHDPVQSAVVQFFEIPGSYHYLELVAPDSENSKLQNAVKKGLPLNHLCYSCVDIEKSLAGLAAQRCFLIQAPVPAVAFEGRPIAWIMTPQRLLVEFVQLGVSGSL